MKARAKKFTDPAQAVEHIQRLYQQSVTTLRTAFQKFVDGHPPKSKISAMYPAIEIEGEQRMNRQECRQLTPTPVRQKIFHGQSINSLNKLVRPTCFITRSLCRIRAASMIMRPAQR